MTHEEQKGNAFPWHPDHALSPEPDHKPMKLGHEGLVPGVSGGRQDIYWAMRPIDGYVLPADTVAFIGAAKLDALTRPGAHPKPLSETICCLLSAGEYIVSPEYCRHVGGGDLEAGWAAMRDFVLISRALYIERLEEGVQAISDGTGDLCPPKPE